MGMLRNALFVPDDEKRLVEEVFSNAVDCLSDEDKKLPQVSRTGPHISFKYFYNNHPVFELEHLTPCTLEKKPHKLVLYLLKEKS